MLDEATDALELRFAPLEAVGVPNLLGMVGLVGEGREPIPLRVVTAGPATPPGEAVERAMADVRASMANVAARKAAERTASDDTHPVAEALVALMRDDLRRKGLDSDYTGVLADEEDDPELVADIADRLGSNLAQVDAFRVTAGLCRELQIPGGMDVLALVQPLCGRVAALAADAAFAREAVAEVSARRVPAGLAASTFKLLAAQWRERVMAPVSPAP